MSLTSKFCFGRALGAPREWRPPRGRPQENEEDLKDSGWKGSMLSCLEDIHTCHPGFPVENSQGNYSSALKLMEFRS